MIVDALIARSPCPPVDVRDPEWMRRAFIRMLGQAPQALRGVVAR